jgi:hypothetical protein
VQELRKAEPAVPDQLGTYVDVANAALDKILEIVPEEDLDQGREVVEVLRRGAPGMVPAPEELSKEEEAAAQRLRQLL